MSYDEELAPVSAHAPWPVLREQFRSLISTRFAEWIPPGSAHFDEQLQFALGRFDEGLGIVRFVELFEKRAPAGPLSFLDIGAGNGGVSIALANCQRYKVNALDITPNAALRALVSDTRLPVHQIVGSGHHLPFENDSIDVVTLLETIEHVPSPKLLGSEIMRVLRPGGFCMITTPQRVKYLLRPDPHYNVRGLLWFPNFVQRFIVTKLLRRKYVSHDLKPLVVYDVDHIYFHVREISRLFPGEKIVEPMYDAVFRPGTFARFSRDWFHWHLREFFWDRILIFKPPSAAI